MWASLSYSWSWRKSFQACTTENDVSCGFSVYKKLFFKYRTVMILLFISKMNLHVFSLHVSFLDAILPREARTVFSIILFSPLDCACWDDEPCLFAPAVSLTVAWCLACCRCSVRMYQRCLLSTSFFLSPVQEGVPETFHFLNAWILCEGNWPGVLESGVSGSQRNYLTRTIQ